MHKYHGKGVVDGGQLFAVKHVDALLFGLLCSSICMAVVASANLKLS
jgi:hypothetical protein